ncbi:MAG: malto-oligosyltrehalose trehalohydrolase [Propionibacteriales bacterium]|nr:malto-oligosyltrehalose trehalohydrolase [Propionibacteriales bacterium]
MINNSMINNALINRVTVPHHRRFDVWAPIPERVRLVVSSGGAPDEVIEMRRADDRWWSVDDEVITRYAGEVDYGYLLDDDDTVLPDPRSRWQPDGVHGRSRTYDLGEYEWADAGWTGRSVAGAVIYELHIGTWTPEGTLDAAIDRLDHLVDLGVDFVELLPVNAFNGEHNWGYDGVAWFAVQHTYGGPAAYQRFVDACHRRGLGVIQDVVHNHLGPSGNYLPRFGPYLSGTGTSTWGAKINIDGPGSDEVRAFILDNVAMWFTGLHVDALRLDAVHALSDHTAVHLLEEMAIETAARSVHLGRPLGLIAESDLNDPKLIMDRSAGGYGLDAQWSDDFHHALITNLTGDTRGWFGDFASLDALVKVINSGFLHDGAESTFRGRRHGRPIPLQAVPTTALTVYAANHDQIGNRADGSRLRTRLSDRQLALAATLVLLSSHTVMIFAGEEWGAGTPWAFFTSHPEPELGRATGEGRIAEFAAMDWDVASIPDPQEPATFIRSKINWDEPEAGPYAELLAHHQVLTALRRGEPAITDPRFGAHRACAGGDRERWLRVDSGPITVVANFDIDDRTVPLLGAGAAEVLLSVGEVDLGDGQVILGAHSHVVLRRSSAH